MLSQRFKLCSSSGETFKTLSSRNIIILGSRCLNFKISKLCSKLSQARIFLTQDLNMLDGTFRALYNLVEVTNILLKTLDTIGY